MGLQNGSQRQRKTKCKEIPFVFPLLLGTAALSASSHLKGREFAGTAGRQLKQVSDRGDGYAGSAELPLKP